MLCSSRSGSAARVDCNFGRTSGRGETVRLGQQPRGHGPGSPAPATDAATNRGPFVRRVLAYLALTKPRVIELLLVATIPAMLLADRGHVDLPLIVCTLFGGWMGAASANTLNCVADADIDKVMKRTARRPLARDGGADLARAGVRTAARCRVVRLAVVDAPTCSAACWWLRRSCSTSSSTRSVLKRRTSQNVVWGGAAGCMPVLVGWAAVTGTIGWQAVVLFLVIFFWTPPHTWALAMRYKEDYAAAGVPMLPVVATEQQVTRQIVVYTWLDRVRDAGTGAGGGDRLRGRRSLRGRVVPLHGAPAVRGCAARRIGETAAVVPAVEQLPRRRVLRPRGGLGARLGDVGSYFG